MLNTTNNNTANHAALSAVEQLCSNFIWVDKSKRMERFSLAVGVISIVGCLFNIFVLVRILTQGLRRSHFSKIYYFSLSVADLIVAACSIGYTFVFHDIVTITRGNGFWYVAVGTTWVSVMSSLLHVVAITADRFIATMFPMYYHADKHRKHRKVTVAILSIWIISIAVVISMAWHYQIAFWLAAVCIPLASLGIVGVYTHIVIISIKRHIVIRTGQPVADLTECEVQTEDIKKSMNTVLLGMFVTLSYVICNLPLSITVITYLWDRTCPSLGRKVIVQALLTINTLIDPMLYAAFDLVVVLREKTRKKINDLSVAIAATDVSSTLKKNLVGNQEASL